VPPGSKPKLNSTECMDSYRDLILGCRHFTLRTLQPG
jgi:hypothetical protein